MMSILLTGIGNSVVFPMFLGLLVLTLANGRNVGYTNEKLVVLHCCDFAKYRLRNRRFLVRIQMGVLKRPAFVGLLSFDNRKQTHGKTTNRYEFFQSLYWPSYSSLASLRLCVRTA
jgi:hypothetical protein